MHLSHWKMHLPSIAGSRWQISLTFTSDYVGQDGFARKKMEENVLRDGISVVLGVFCCFDLVICDSKAWESSGILHCESAIMAHNIP